MKLHDTNKYYLPNTGKRFIHVATVLHGVREYMCFFDKLEGKLYIEEITGGSLEYIRDDSLAADLHHFLVAQGVLNNQPIIVDDEWLRYNPHEK